MHFNGITRQGEQGAPILVLLHGLGADEHDLMPLAAELDPKLTIISLRAPLETGYGGFSWFDIQFFPDGSRTMNQEQAATNCAKLIEDLETLHDSAAAGPKLLLGGFSQGAMMSAGVLLQRPDLVHAAWLMSGRLLPVFDRDVPTTIPRPVLVQHGLQDDLVLIAEGRHMASHLREMGHEVGFREYDVAHGIDYEELVDAREWIGTLIS